MLARNRSSGLRRRPRSYATTLAECCVMSNTSCLLRLQVSKNCSRTPRAFTRKRRMTRRSPCSVHAPEVECIAKGKAHKKYEFGCKVAFVTTSKSNWIVGVEAHHGNPYDGATL